ncbi:MAG TPA: OmpA family protein [Allosphingosinicella sp.]|jgi:peptidoglycan-associated lipoprotein|nr:OmpA family protein [Allosphingosinicella sp.]
MPGRSPLPAAARSAGVGEVFGLIAGALLDDRRRSAAFIGGAGSASRTGARLDFESGEAALTPAARETVEGVARQMTANSRLEVFIEGHADRRGTEAANIELAGRRAEAAAAYLTERGVAADRITTISWGEAAAETRAEDGDGVRDRRVVITLRRRARPTP